MRILFVIFALSMLVIIGCSGVTSLNSPDTSNPRDVNSPDGSHITWGLWQFIANPAAKTLDVVQLRQGNFHANVLPFLEPPVLVNLTLETLQFNGNIIETDIGLRHPFVGLTEFTGFDVCGILISNGSTGGYSDPALLMPGAGDTRLLNPDFYTRWWNPAEFPVNDGTIGAYNDGLLGTPDGIANFSATLNGCKYYCDDITNPDGDLTAVTQANRGMFSAGQKNIRHFTIEIGTDGLVFNYAVDACWRFPEGTPPFQAPDDFTPETNRAEAWRVNATEVDNTLWNDGTGSGGDLSLSLNVYDWLNAGLNTVRVESPGNFNLVGSSLPISSGAGYSTYEIDITDATPGETSIDLLISVVSEQANFGGFITGTNTSSYFMISVPVSPDAPVNDALKNIPLRPGVHAYDLGVDPVNGDLWVGYSDHQIYKATLAGGYLDSTYKYTISTYSNFDRCDTAANGNTFFIASSASQVNGEAWIYHSDGSNGLASGWGGGDNWLVDVANYGTTGTYANDLMLFVGYFHTLYSMNIVMVRGYFEPDYMSNPCNFTETWNYTYTGFDKVHHEYVKGMDTGIEGDNMWFLEVPDYYCAAFTLTGGGYYKNFGYNNSYFGTGSPSDGDDCWTAEARDIAHDPSGRFHILDYVNGVPTIKVFTGSSAGGQSIGHYGDAQTIIGEPQRIDGSDYDGSIFVLHGDDTNGFYLSVFTAAEQP